MWFIIIFLMFLTVLVGFLYLITRISRFNFFGKHFKSRKMAYLVSALLLAVLFAVFSFLLSTFNAAVIFIHLILVWIICDVVSFIYRKVTKKSAKRYITGVVAVCVTVVYLCVGCFFAFYVFRTEYTVSTDKISDLQSLKIVGFSDSHIGTTFGYKGFSQYVDKINSENPDVVVIVGDYVDDSTSLTDMENSCKALSKLKPKYGTYYVFGNHDAGYMSASRRGYGKEELKAKLTENGVKVLEDETVNLAENILLVGRKDASDRERLPALALVDKTKYTVVLDHQPADYDMEALSGADLVLSGHTHGGQLIPINRVGKWIGVNDNTYGYERRKNTDFIISSGLSCWEMYFKTGCISEYFVVNVISNDK